MTGHAKPRAFILLGGFRVMMRNWLYLTELAARDLRILVITSEGWRSTAERAMARGEWPASLITETSFVEGEVGLEGAFTAGVIARVLSWRARYEIAGVFAVGEMFVEQTGITADMLGLPSPGLRASRACRSKYLQRAYLPEWSPQVTVIPAEDRFLADLAAVRFPSVLKPAGRRSSSGVRIVSDEAELRASLGSYPAGETLLAEDCVTGPEFSVETLVKDGRIRFESLTRKGTTEGEGPFFVELSHTVPAPDDPANARLLAANREIIERLGFADGIAHAELRLAPGGRVMLMEIAARTPGDGLMPLYHLATGQPLEPEVIKITLGEDICYPQPKRCSRQVYLPASTGTLSDVRVSYPGFGEPAWSAQGEAWPEIKPGHPDDPPALRAVLVLKQRGEALRPFTESDDRVVTYLIDARSIAELDELDAAVSGGIELITDEERKGEARHVGS